MSSKRYRVAADLAPDKWVNLESPIRFSFAGAVGQVIRVSGATTYVKVERSAGPVTECVKNTRIAFVSDTRAEAQMLFDSSLDFAKKALLHEKKLLARITRSQQERVEKTLRMCNGSEKSYLIP